MADTSGIKDVPDASASLDADLSLDGLQHYQWPDFCEVDPSFFSMDGLHDLNTDLDFAGPLTWESDPTTSTGLDAIGLLGPTGTDFFPVATNDRLSSPFDERIITDISTVDGNACICSLPLNQGTFLAASDNSHQVYTSQYGVPLADTLEQPPMAHGVKTNLNNGNTSTCDLDFIDPHARVASVMSQSTFQYSLVEPSDLSNTPALLNYNGTCAPSLPIGPLLTSVHEFLTEHIPRTQMPGLYAPSGVTGIKRKHSPLPSRSTSPIRRKSKADKYLESIPGAEVHSAWISMPASDNHGRNKRKDKPLTAAKQFTRTKGACLRCRERKKECVWTDPNGPCDECATVLKFGYTELKGVRLTACLTKFSDFEGVDLSALIGKPIHLLKPYGPAINIRLLENTSLRWTKSVHAAARQGLMTGTEPRKIFLKFLDLLFENKRLNALAVDEAIRALVILTCLRDCVQILPSKQKQRLDHYLALVYYYWSIVAARLGSWSDDTDMAAVDVLTLNTGQLDHGAGLASNAVSRTVTRAMLEGYLRFAKFWGPADGQMDAFIRTITSNGPNGRQYRRYYPYYDADHLRCPDVYDVSGWGCGKLTIWED